MPRIFLSHSSVDGRQATALKQWLSDQDPALRREIFLDTDRETGMVGGAEWEATIDRALDSCQAVLCLVSPNWEASKECHYEYKSAAAKNKTVFCARLDNVSGLGLISRYQRRELFPGGDGPTTAIDLGDQSDPVLFASDGLRRLLRDVQSPDLSADSFGWPPPGEPDRAPYRGWVPFEACDAAVFFGRDAEIRSALEALEGIHGSGRNRLFVILGPSGTGKSSFLRAGILPRLHLDSDRFTVLGIVRPGRDEALTGDQGLAKSIHTMRARLGLTAPSLGEIKATWIHDADKTRSLLLECQQRCSDADSAPMLVLPIDQAEELFSSEAGPEARALLGLGRDLLSAGPAAGVEPLRLIIAVTIRTDRYEVMQTADEFSGVDTLLFNDLKPMRKDRFQQVIEGPARRATEGGRPLSVDTRLVDRLLADATATTSGGDALPLLSGTLARLYTDYGATGGLTSAQYEQLGGIDRVVQTEIDKILSNDESVRNTQLALLREAFIPYLATVSESDEPMRRIGLFADLPPTCLPLIEKLVDARILIRDRRDLDDGHGGQQDVVEIALESFLRQWAELAGWLRDAREDLKSADELLRTAARWHSSDCDAAYLYPVRLLEKAEALSATTTFGRQLESTREFLVASRQQVSNEQRDKEAMLRRNAVRLGLVLAVAVAVAVVAVGAFVSARHSQRVAQQSARDATAQKLVAESQALLTDTREGDDVRALKQLLAANKLAAVPSERPLLDALVNRFGMKKVLETKEPVIAVAASDDGHRLAMAEPGGIRVWDTGAANWSDDLRDGGRLLANDGAKLTSMAISSDGRRIVSGNDVGVVQVWDTSETQPVSRVIGRRHQGRVTSVAISRDGGIASAGVDGVVDIMAPDGAEMAPITVGGMVFAVAFNPAGNQLAIGTADGGLRLFGLGGPAVTAGPQNPGAHAGGVMSLAYSPDGRLLASGGADTKVRLWNSDTLAPVRELTGHTATVTSVAFNADGSRLASGGNDRTVGLWDVGTGSRIGDPMRGHGGLVLSVDFISDGNEIVSGGNEHTLRLWDADLGQPLSTPIGGRSGPLTDVAISPDGHSIVSGGADRTVRVFNVDTGIQIAAMSEHTGVVTSVAFSPSGDAVASASTDGTVRLWRPGGSAPPVEFDAGRPLTAVEFSPRGGRLAAAGVDGQVILWDLLTGRKTLLENKDQVITYGLSFDPRSDRIASVSASGYLRMWQLTDGRQLWQSNAVDHLPADVVVGEHVAQGYPGPLITVAFSPDGQRVAAGGVNWTSDGGAVGFVQRFNADDGTQTGEPFKVGLAVMDIAFSPRSEDSGGDRMVVASFDPYEVQLWNSDSPKTAEFIFADHQAQVVSVVISADGRRIVSASADGAVRVWPNLPTVAPEVALCSKLTSDIGEQWATWISKEFPAQPVCDRP